MIKHLIYGLYCPFTNNLHYIGKTSRGFIRPNQHVTKSHSKKINEWVSQLKFLGHKPIIKILEECTAENLDEKEIEWIDNAKTQNQYLLNVSNNSVDKILDNKDYNVNNLDLLKIGKKIKFTRKEHNYSQEYVCKMTNISRPTLNMIERGSGKTTLNYLKKVLDVFGFEITIKKTNNEKNNTSSTDAS